MNSKYPVKLLVIDDNLSLVTRLQTYMGDQYRVEVATTGAEGLKKTESSRYHAIILDLGLPDQSGETVCRQIRDRGIPTPILVLTGEKNVGTKVRLLELGADDYLTKPFKLAELQARIAALLRRTRSTPFTLVVGDLTIDLERRRVERAGKTIDLRRKEFDILEYLALNHGRIITRSMILDRVWESADKRWNNTIDVHIKRLRDKVDRPFDRPLIKTAYGLGYMLDA